jgi:hypothetical protein
MNTRRGSWLKWISKYAVTTLVVGFALSGPVYSFGGRPTPIDPTPPAAPDGVPEPIDDPVGGDNGVKDPVMDPTEPPDYLIEPKPDEILELPPPAGDEIMITAAPDAPHSLREVPEPATLSMAGIGLAVLAYSRYRRRNRS